MKSIALLGLVTIIVSCNTTKMSIQATEALPPVIVYKTTGDYYNLVPVTLNETRDKVVSFPAPSDLYTNGKLALPVKLLMNSITDPNPFELIYDCGKINEFKNPEHDLNKLIRKQFKGCSSLLR